ncbi:MAG: hypothetical protein HUJ68_05345, partial [Clostridia bacterium]|nr:hypothetical protein [Clostridia bacterium]
MKKIILLIAFLFICLTFAKTWEAYLQRCDGLGGFWFPDHNWTDKGEPWIKPFLFGENLRDYGETGLSFNYIEPESACRSYYDCNDLYNPFDLKYTAPQNSKYSTNDSILFLVHRKQVDSVDNLNTKENITGGFPEESFSLVDVIDDALFIDSIPFTMFDAYQYSPFGYLFIYKKRSDKFEYNALCLIQNSMFYKIQCEFQDDGTMNFDKIP